MSEERNDLSSAPRQIRDRFTFLLVIGATFGLQSLTLVTGVIIARVLGVEGRGAVALVFALGLFTSQLTFGSAVPVALAKMLAERRIAARDGWRDIARRRALLLLLPCLAAGGFMWFLQRSETGDGKYVLAVAALVLALQTMVFRIVTGGLQGEGRLVRMAWAGLMPQFLFTVVLVTGWVAGWDWSVLGLLLAYFLASFLALVFAFCLLLQPTHLPGDRLDESELWSESRRNYVSSVRPLDGLALDRIVVGGLIGNVGLGLFAAASAVSNLCSLVSNAVAVIVLPRVAMHQGDRPVQRAVIRRWVSLSTMLIVVLVVLLEIVVSPLIRIAFGEEFSGAIPCARWLIVADGFMAIRKVLIAVMQGQGQGGIASWVELALLPVMGVSIVVAALHDSLPAIGISLTFVGVLSCLALGLAVLKGDAGQATNEVMPTNGSPAN